MKREKKQVKKWTLSCLNIDPDKTLYFTLHTFAHTQVPLGAKLLHNTPHLRAGVIIKILSYRLWFDV